MENIIEHGDGAIDLSIATEEAQKIELKEGQLAMGYRVPTSVKVPVSYLDELRSYKDVYNDIYRQIEVCNKLYKYNGIIGSAVDILVDFAVTEVYPQSTGNQALDDLLLYWFKNVNEDNLSIMSGIYPIMQEIGLEWFTSGNAFPYTKWENVDIDGGTFKLPHQIIMINPAAIEIPAESIAFGQKIIYLKDDLNLRNNLTRDGRSFKEAALLKQVIPRSVVNKAKEFNRTTGPIRLDPKFVTHLARKNKSYQVWGVPYLSRCFSAASTLERLRQLDESITTGLMNLVTIFKVGTELQPASPARLAQLANLLKNPKATTTLVWAHDLEVTQVGPDGKLLAFKDKYNDAKQELLTAMGIPPTLMSIAQQGDAWVSILSLVERLSNWRRLMTIWLEKQCDNISLYNGHKEKVKVKWNRMHLANEAEVKNLILTFYDRGLISVHTALRDSSYDYDAELSQKKAEKKDQTAFAPPILPFSKQGNTPNAGGRPDAGSMPAKKKKTKIAGNTSTTVNDKKVKLKPSTPTKA